LSKKWHKKTTVNQNNSFENDGYLVLLTTNLSPR